MPLRAEGGEEVEEEGAVGCGHFCCGGGFGGGCWGVGVVWRCEIVVVCRVRLRLSRVGG